jgi:hypothetical protein
VIGTSKYLTGFLVLLSVLFSVTPRVAGLVAAVLGSHKTADNRYERRHRTANYHHIGLR